MLVAAVATIVVLAFVATLLVLRGHRPTSAAGGSSPVPAAVARSADRLLGDKPYVRLFTQLDSCEQLGGLDRLRGAQRAAALDQIAKWYVHVHVESPGKPVLGRACGDTSKDTLAAELVRRKVWASNYRNGSYVSQAAKGSPVFGEAADIEAKAPLAIATFWPGDAAPGRPGNDRSPVARLAGALSPGTTTVKVTSAASVAPRSASSTWPYFASRGAGAASAARSTSTSDVVSWVRVDDELLQVTATTADAGNVATLAVRRGLFGTHPAAHQAGARVLSPVYIGSTRADPLDKGLSGAPSRGNRDAPLRYGIKIWEPAGYHWLAGRMKATFGPGLSGYDTMWLDVSSCMQYNNADAFGNPVEGWDDPRRTKLTQDAWGAYQKVKVDGLRAAMPGVRFVANSFTGRTDPCDRRLLSSVYDGGVLENWLKVGKRSTWQGQMRQSFEAQAGNWPALYWVRWNRGQVPDQARYKRFAYGSMLLAYRPTATRFQFGGPWRLGKPDQLYFWNWGAPLSTPAGVGDLATDAGLYRRDFANGRILVNPGTQPITYQVPAGFVDVSSGAPRSATSVTVEPGDAAFLLHVSS